MSQDLTTEVECLHQLVRDLESVRESEARVHSLKLKLQIAKDWLDWRMAHYRRAQENLDTARRKAKQEAASALEALHKATAQMQPLAAVPPRTGTDWYQGCQEAEQNR